MVNGLRRLLVRISKPKILTLDRLGQRYHGAMHKTWVSLWTLQELHLKENGVRCAHAAWQTLVRLAEIIERDADRLGELEVRDNGKLIAEMNAQTRYLAEWYRYYGGLADKVEGAVLPSAVRNFQFHAP